MRELLYLAFGALMGGLVTHLLHTARYRRAVFNGATTGLRAKLLTHLSHLDNGRVIGFVSEADVIAVAAEIGDSKYRKIHSSYRKYASALKQHVQHDEFGQMKALSDDGFSEIRDAAQELYERVQPK